MPGIHSLSVRWAPPWRIHEYRYSYHSNI